jgi:Zn-dependent hydrolases, including glyoxylases
MDQITESAYWLRSAVGAHCYWFEDGRRSVIVDPGMSLGLDRVARELRRAGRSPYQVTDILLTHHDFDHAHAAAAWQERTGARVWLGAADIAVLAGAAEPLSPRRRLTARLARVALPGRLHPLDGDAELWPGLTALHAPAHTPGHHCFRWRNVLFVGDAARVEDGRLRPSPSWQMTDNAGSPAELARLSALGVDWYCAGHSDPARRR